VSSEIFILFKSGVFAAKILNIVVLRGHIISTYFVFYGCALFVYRSSSNLCSHISTVFWKRQHPADPATNTSVSKHFSTYWTVYTDGTYNILITLYITF
jgi:hypothetical protein